jgi:hypothetical protein
MRLATALAWPLGRTEGQMPLTQLAKPRWQAISTAAAPSRDTVEIDDGARPSTRSRPSGFR